MDADRFADTLAAALKAAELYALKGGFVSEDEHRRKMAAHFARDTQLERWAQGFIQGTREAADIARTFGQTGEDA